MFKTLPSSPGCERHKQDSVRLGRSQDHLRVGLAAVTPVVLTSKVCTFVSRQNELLLLATASTVTTTDQSLPLATLGTGTTIEVLTSKASAFVVGLFS